MKKTGGRKPKGAEKSQRSALGPSGKRDVKSNADSARTQTDVIQKRMTTDSKEKRTDLIKNWISF